MDRRDRRGGRGGRARLDAAVELVARRAEQRRVGGQGAGGGVEGGGGAVEKTPRMPGQIPHRYSKVEIPSSPRMQPNPQSSDPTLVVLLLSNE